MKKCLQCKGNFDGSVQKKYCSDKCRKAYKRELGQNGELGHEKSDISEKSDKKTDKSQEVGQNKYQGLSGNLDHLTDTPEGKMTVRELTERNKDKTLTIGDKQVPMPRAPHCKKCNWCPIEDYLPNWFMDHLKGGCDSYQDAMDKLKTIEV